MEQLKKQYSILITTKNRKGDLLYTLNKIISLINRFDVECIICDDGSTDGTFNLIREKYPQIHLLRNNKSKGLIYSRNLLLNLTQAKFAISLDDDSNFLSESPLEVIEKYFLNNDKCGLVSFSIFWNKMEPFNLHSSEHCSRVKGFVGCGHAWNIEAWHDTPNYPEWFVFYGEEDFAAFQLFKKGWEVHYVPEILVHHRVDLKARKNEKDYRLRLRRSLRSGWYLYMMFYPWHEIPRRFAYTLWMQIKNKVYKGDWRSTVAIMQALGDLVINLPRLLYNANRLTTAEFKAYSKLPETKLYWTPENIQKI